MRLSTILEGIECSVIYEGEWEREISSLSTDSRKAADSALFFCLSGGETDSHKFARSAVQKGAVAVVVEREIPVSVPQILVKDSREALGKLAAAFYKNPSERLSVVGVTGTNGKTTTTYILQSIFEEAGYKTGIIGTLGILYAGKEISSPLTTPDPIFLQETLAKMLAAGVEYVFMEVSAHALYYKKTAGVRFSACIFTNLSQDHLDFFKTMEEYKRAKEGLFPLATCPLAILNGDDSVGREIGDMRQKEGGRCAFYGLNTPVDAFAVVTDESLYSTECMLNIDDKLCRVSLFLQGRHNVYNALAAATCAFASGIPMHVIGRGIGRVKGVAGRLQRIASHAGGEIFVDFAHTPDGLKSSLDSLKAHCQGRLLCLFGCGGNRDKGKRALMGEIAAKQADFSVLTSDNPRYEDPMDILSEIERGHRRFSSRYVIVPDRVRAIDYALSYMREGDILLIAGKGGERYQEIMGIKYPFDDHAMVVELLRHKDCKK